MRGATVEKQQLSTATIANPTSAEPTFVPDLAGTYKLQLFVNNGCVDSALSTIAFIAKPTNVTVVQVLNNLQASSSKLDQANFKNKN